MLLPQIDSLEAYRRVGGAQETGSVVDAQNIDLFHRYSEGAIL